MIIIYVNIPEEFFEKVTTAMFAAGAGKLEHYDQCCFVSKGIGQFRPLAESTPYIGNKQELTKVNEFKIEMACNEQNYNAVVQAMLAAHPYETPYWYAQKVLSATIS